VESAELIAMLREVRDRVRSRYPAASAAAPGVALPDLEPLVRARDAAMAKVAAIGAINPRRAGPLNALVQGSKRLMARALDWHVREQVIFNRKTIEVADAAIEALAASNRALAAAGGALSGIESRCAALEQLGAEMKDMRAHWAEWRVEWERKLAQNEIQFLRSVADLQKAFSYRADLMDANYRDALRAQHADFTAALARTNLEIQNALLANMERVKLDYERLIHTELRLIRQRLAAPVDAAPAAGAPPPRNPPLDFARFAERFRGPEDRVKASQRRYVERFAGRRQVLDIGCGRGEFLELMREAGVPAAGIDTNAECVAVCRDKGLDARAADLFACLADLPEDSLDGIFCAHLVEHLDPLLLPRMLQLCATRLARGGVIAIETPNPECLAIFASYFYLDPTHVRPVPRQLLEFYFAEHGIGVLEFRLLAPAVEGMPALEALPEDFRQALFGGLDYALIGAKL
jgi:O-antigen chain-terminating methyltransferase